MQPHDTTPLKVCSKCGESKPATPEYFQRDKYRKDGLTSQCKVCRAGNTKSYYYANRDRKIAKAQAWNDAHKERKAENARLWFSVNRERIAQVSRRWEEANAERVRKRRRTRYAENRERALEKNRAWRAANPEKARAASRRRRVRLLGAEGTHTTADIQLQYKRQKGKCYWCGVKVGDKYHVDHVVPLSRGGSNWPENLVVACPSCNASKNDRLPHEWPDGGRLL